MIFQNIITKALIDSRRREVTRSLALFATTYVKRQNNQSKMKEMKYILVTGGVISGVGKGVIASSFGTLLNCCGISVTSLKIDPYINIDAGTFSPYEHGKFKSRSLYDS